VNLPEFDRPFGAGDLAEFFPGTLAIDFGLTRRQITNLNAGERLAQALAEVKQGATRGETFQALPFETKRFYAVRAHEHDHLRRFLSTTYGFLCDRIRCLWLAQVGQLVGETTERNPDSLLPLPAMPSFAGMSFENALSAIGHAAKSTSHTATLVRGLADLLAALADDVSPACLASALWALTNGQAAEARALSFGVDLTRDPCSAHPVVDRFGRSQGLSARHLLELFAIGEHGNAFLRTGSELSDVEELLGGAQREYALAILAWRSVFPNDDVPDVDSHPRCDDDLIIDWYRLFPFELFVAADLALWPPFFPDDDLGIEGVLNWTDLDPGRRFVRTHAAFVDLGIGPTCLPADRRNELFVELQDRVCQHLGWPTPRQLALAWFDHLTAHLQSGTSPWQLLDGLSDYRVQNATKLLAARIARPADTVLNNLDFPSLGIEGSPIWLVGEEDDRRTLVAMGPQKSRAFIPLMMMEGARHLLNRDRRVFTPLFDQRFRQTAVETLAHLLAQSAGWADALRDQFLRETHASFGTHRTLGGTPLS